jgi:hypothetical protein
LRKLILGLPLRDSSAREISTSMEGESVNKDGDVSAKPGDAIKEEPRQGEKRRVAVFLSHREKAAHRLEISMMTPSRAWKKTAQLV